VGIWEYGRLCVNILEPVKRVSDHLQEDFCMLSTPQASLRRKIREAPAVMELGYHIKAVRAAMAEGWQAVFGNRS